VFEGPRIGAHQRQQLARVDDADRGKRQRHQQRDEIACTPVTAASSCLPSPMRRAITAVTAIARPIAMEYSRNR
jgi:hypothetical protein